jgi:hypothetical protein
VPVVLPLTVPLLVLLAAVAALALAQTENQWLRPLVEGLAHPRGSFLKRTAMKAAGLIVGGLLYVEKHVRSVLSRFANASLHVITRWLNAMTGLWHGIANEFAQITDDVADALTYLRHNVIPHLIHAAVAPVNALAHKAEADARRSISLVRKAERDFTRGIDRLEHALKTWALRRFHGIDRLLREHVLPGLHSVERTLGRVVSRDIPALRRREAALEREVYGDLRARVGRIEKALGLGVFAALVYRILARVAPWIFCRNVNKLGRAVCSLDDAAMQALLAGLLGAVAIEDLQQLARFEAAIAKDVAAAVREVLSA